MDIVLKDVTITVVENVGADVLLFYPKNINSGQWPFTGNHHFKTEVAKGTSREWLLKEFGDNILRYTRIISDGTGDTDGYY